MNEQFLGFLIRKERLSRNWSQEGLCHGICAVSYLSKIEQGKVVAGDEIIKLLFERMETKWGGDEDDVAHTLAEKLYDAIFSCQKPDVKMKINSEYEAQAERFLNGPHALDFMLIQRFIKNEGTPLEPELEPYLDRRQLALQRILQERYNDALRLHPCAYMYLSTGIDAYERGENTLAIGSLRTAYDLSAEAGQAQVMLLCRLYMGNSCSNMRDYPRMLEHYVVAERLAEALGDDDSLQSIKYNTASTAMEVGQFEQPYEYFSKLSNPDIRSLHKLAICCEKLGRRDEALEALAGAERSEDKYTNEKELWMRMCDVVRYRLEHPEYLRDDEYGKLLLGCVAELQEKFPIGYAGFHIPWVIEWYTATRQYKQAYELLRDFPLAYR